MVRVQTNKRRRLIEAATRLAHKHGFRETSLADIAEAAQVPLDIFGAIECGPLLCFEWQNASIPAS